MARSADFDRIVAVDWSASSRPKRGRDSIWICAGERASVADPINPTTRAAALDVLVELCDAPGRVLLLVDFSLGYPHGSAAMFSLAVSEATEPWRAMHRHLADVVIDDADNANNRFEVAAELNARTVSPGPFWGAPRSIADHRLAATKPRFNDVAVGEWREAERMLRARRRWPASCWQLIGAGSVGSQSLLGIARIAELRLRLGGDRTMAIWPFETGLARPDPAVDVVVAEMWPTLLGDHEPVRRGWTRDAAQVDLAVRTFAAAASSARLDEWFAPSVTDAGAVVAEEGWMLGLI